MLIWVAILATLFAVTPAIAASDEVEGICTRLYPSVTQYFAYRQCVKEQTKSEQERNLKELEEERKKAREDGARPCIANDLARMEGLAEKARTALRPQFSLEDAQTTLAPIVGQRGTIQVTKDNIKERVLIFEIRTKCDSEFYFLVNVRGAQDGTLRWYRTWAENAPTGYYHQGYSIDFEEQKKEALRRAEAERDKAAQEAAVAKARRLMEEQSRGNVQGIQISNVKMRCMGNCSSRTLEFDVTNLSGEPVGEISFGWMLPPPEMKDCPANLATNDRFTGVVQPGQTVQKTIYVTGTSEGTGARYCIKVTNVRAPYPWQR